jgi:hypothetical protein
LNRPSYTQPGLAQRLFISEEEKLLLHQRTTMCDHRPEVERGLVRRRPERIRNLEHSGLETQYEEIKALKL